MSAGSDETLSSHAAARIRNKLIRWTIFSVLLGVFPIGAALLSALTRQQSLLMADLIGKGELLLVTVVITAAAAGEGIGAETRRFRSTRILCVSLSILIVLVATYWFADIASAVAAGVVINVIAVTNGSIVVFLSGAVTAAACIVLSEVQ